MQRERACPLYPQLRPRMRSPANRHVPFTTESGRVRCKLSCPHWANSAHGLFDHFVGTGEHGRRNCEAQYHPASLFVPELTNKWRGHKLVVGDRLRNQTVCEGEPIQTVDSFRPNVCVVERRISRHQTANQRSLFHRKEPGPYPCGEKRICLERTLGLYNCSHRGGGNLWLLIDELVGCCQRCEIIQARSRRAIASPQMEMDFCNTELLADCRAHAVAPKGIRASLDRVDAIVSAPQFVFAGDRTRNDLNLVPFEIDPRFGQHVLESHVGKCC